jgi:hypothetical protein
MSDHIWDRKTGEQIAWVENGCDVYSVATMQKFATVRDGKLYALNRQFLKLYLENLQADLVSSGKDTEALAKFKRLACEG